MAVAKNSFGNCVTFVIVALFIAEVTPWTIDLPEMRKLVFEHNDHLKELEQEKHEENKEIVIQGRYYYSNREGNSAHNSEHYEDVHKNKPYAKGYGYQSYMEKKVHSIVYNGSKYLDGLQRSLNEFTRVLEDCTRRNRTNTSWRPMHEFPANSTSNSSVDCESNSSVNCRSNSSVSCQSVTRVSEHVRRLSQLAMWTTRELQDLAYTKKYRKGDPSDISKQENELILKLAWFLDRLAHYTGYEPHLDHPGKREEEPTTTTTSLPMSLMNASNNVTRFLMNCLKNNPGNESATVRCAYPEPMPDLARLINNYNDEDARRMFSPPAASPSNINEQVLPISFSEQITPSNGNEELLVASDFDPTRILSPFTRKSVQKRAIKSLPKPDMTKLPPLTAVKVKKRAKVIKDKLAKMAVMSAVKIKKPALSKLKKKAKRDVGENPAYTFLKYFAKTKAWINDNIDNYKMDTDSVLSEYEVKNELDQHSISKRSIDRPIVKKYAHFRLPEDPFQDISGYIKHKKGVHYVKNIDLAAKIKASLDEMRKPANYLTTEDKKPDIFTLLKNSERPKRSVTFNKMAAAKSLTDKTLFRPRRSIKFQQNLDKPRDSEDPQQDISYYIKNKPGTRINPSLTQAAQVRAGLQQIFQTGNIEVVRRYGANYNPLVPAPFYVAVMKSMADN